MNGKRDNIYIYLWENLNTIYVGRTINPKVRHYAHKHRESEKTYQFSSEHHVEHPKMIIIENDLTIEEGIKREKYWIKHYKENNYNVLNKSEGGEIGSLGGVKWTKNAVFEEAKKYNSLSQFKYNNNSAYSAARLNGWLVEMHWFSRPKYIKWTKEAVFEEAKKYNKKYHFQIGCGTAYKVALKNGWIAEMDWLKEDKYLVKWTKELTLVESKKYATRNNFHKNSPGAYRSARINGWLDEMIWLKPDVKWTKEAVFEESKKYTTKTEFKKLNSVAYRVAVKNKWIEEMTWIKGKIKKVNE